jgi:hypothetical protein
MWFARRSNLGGCGLLVFCGLLAGALSAGNYAGPITFGFLILVGIIGGGYAQKHFANRRQ